MRTDLGIEGGLVIGPSSRMRANVYVAGGLVVEVTPERRDARQRIDATGLLVMPGMVDTHVHLMDPGSTDREDFPTGTAAAARAGVTTIIEHTHAAPVRTRSELEEKRVHLQDRSRVDFGLAAHAWPDHLEHIDSLWEGGVSFFKVFTCTTHGVPGFDAGHLLPLFRRVASLGSICLVHCEDETITAEAEHALREVGREDPGVIVEWRSRDAEAVAISTVALLARRTGARVVIAHISHADVLELAQRERSAGASISAECCPQYLSLLENEILEHGPFRKFTPPARARNEEELAAMWRALDEGTINHISTDHAPATLQQKTEGSIWDVHFGLPGLDTTFSILLDAAARGLVSYERVVAAYAEVPARTYGFYPRKGTLAPGSDADVVLVDPEAVWTVKDEDVISKAGWSPFSGRTLRGRAVRTMLRGHVIADQDGVLVEPGSGLFLPGPGTGSNGHRS